MVRLMVGIGRGVADGSVSEVDEGKGGMSSAMAIR